LNRYARVPRLCPVPASAYILTLLLAYLTGSIPTGYIAGRARGVDLRTVGSGNIGATNAFRALGTGWGIGVLLVDFAKGFGACLWVPVLVRAGLDPATTVLEPALSLELAAAVGAVLGHNYTVWLRFRGGKGIATTAGALAALVPLALLAGLVVWVLFFGFTRYVSLGSIAAAVTVPVATGFTTRGDVVLTVFTGVLGLMAVLKHRSNIQRLLAGTESRIQLGKRRKAEHS